MPRPIIALLTDFGLHDHYVGTMKGVALGICPDATLIDITHDIPPQDVTTAALELAAAYTYFPRGTVFLCVVDPGVGSARRAIAASQGDRVFVAPDNGLLSLVLDASATVVELTNRRYALAAISRTFEGRDRFAPAAAWIACGTPLAEFGPSVSQVTRLSLPSPRVTASAIHGEVTRVDRFGNLITNIDRDAIAQLDAAFALDVTVGGDAPVPLVATYADVEEGAVCALVGSSGHLEIARRGGSAAERLVLGRGAPVHLVRRA